MAAIKVTASTMGVSTPASLAEGTGHYRYRGSKPDRGPGEPSPLARSHARLRAEKAARFAEFCRLVEREGLTPLQAGKRIGVAPNTARGYERERRAAIKAERGENTT